MPCARSVLRSLRGIPECDPQSPRRGHRNARSVAEVSIRRALLDTGNDVFRKEGWLSRVPEDFCNEVLSRCLVRSFHAGSTISSAGTPARGIYGIARGLVGVEMSAARGEPRLAYTGGAGTWFGISAVMGCPTELASLVARLDCDLRFLPISAIDELMRNDPSRWRHFARVSLADLKRAWSCCDDLKKRAPDGRVVAALLRLGDGRLGDKNSSGVLQVPLTQEEIARDANVGRTVAGNILRRLESEGLVELSYKRVSIVSLAVLRSRLVACDESQ